MATQPPIVVYPNTSGYGPWAVPFPYIDEPDVRGVTATGVEVLLGFVGAGMVENIGPALPANTTLAIYRVTQRLPALATFQPGAVSADQLNTVSLQALMSADELYYQGVARTIQFPIWDTGVLSSEVPFSAFKGKVMGFHPTTGKPMPVLFDGVDLTDAVAQAQAAAASAEADAIQTAADRVATTADRVAAQAARTQAEAARDQAAVYLEGFNLDQFYVDVATGNAAVLNGEYFYVPTSGGLSLYLRTSATPPASPIYTLPSLTAIALRYNTVVLEFLPTSGADTSTPLTPIFQPMNSWVLLTGTAYNIPFIVPDWPYDKPTGSQGCKIRNYGVTSDFLAPPIRDRLGVQLPQGYLRQHDTVIMRRDPTTGFMHLMEAPDNITARMARMVTAFGETPQFPSPIRPLNGVKATDINYFIDLYPNDASYEDALNDMRQSNVARYVMCDMGPFQGIPTAPSFNSLAVRYNDDMVNIFDHTFDFLEAAILTNTGHVPSTPEGVFIVGRLSDPYSGSTAALAGRGHGDELADTSYGYNGWDLRITKNDPTTSNVDVTSANLLPMSTTTRLEGDKLVSTWKGWLQTPAGGTGGSTNAAYITYVHTADSRTAGRDFEIEQTVDFGDVSVTEDIGTAPGTYACMGIWRNVTRMRALKVDPATMSVLEVGPIKVVNQRDGLQSSFDTNLAGNPETGWNAIEAWDHKRWWIKSRLVNMAGPGYTHWEGSTRIDANRVARTAPWFVLRQGWGSKAYDPIWNTAVAPGGALVDISGKKVFTWMRWVVLFPSTNPQP